MPSLPVIVTNKRLPTTSLSINRFIMKKVPILSVLALILGSTSYVHADDMSILIAQKSVQSERAVPSARVSTRSSIQRTSNAAINNNNSSISTIANADIYNQQATNRYPEVQRDRSLVLPAFLSGSYDNVDSKYLPLLSLAETQSTPAAREVISTARAMTLNERTIIQGGCWDYLNAVFKRAGVTRDTIHKGVYRQGPYANSSDIEVGDWLYYINHGYKGIEHSGLFVGWVDESAKQALILSYAGESRREPARYRVYDLSNVYQIMRPTI